jgi:hypothetical protein
MGANYISDTHRLQLQSDAIFISILNEMFVSK